MLQRVSMASGEDSERRKRVRRTTIVLAAVALAFYLGFIIMSVVKASRSEHHSQPPHTSEPQG